MAKYTYKELKEKYANFMQPVIVLKINGKDFAKNAYGFVVSDVEVELTCGFEASIASFSLYDVFDMDNSYFRIADAKEYITLGSAVEIALGYVDQAQVVFCGYIARVNFQYQDGEIPCIRITAMDVKGAMMAGNYSKQRFKKETYETAVKEILKNYTNEIINSNNIVVADIPGENSALDRTVEMVAESDYEFLVKVAKRFNYEFFTECGNVYFRKAKDTNELVMEMGPGEGLRHFDVEYDITGLVSSVEARGMNVGKGKLLKATKALQYDISIGNYAKAIVGKSKKVYLDASIHSEDEAKQRAASLVEEISYRFGTLECDCVGMPELLPGKFFVLRAIGAPPENQFYLQRVIHKMNQEDGFITKLYGKAASIKQKTPGGVSNGLI